MSNPFRRTGANLVVALALGVTSTSGLAKSVIVELNDAPVAHQIYQAKKSGSPLTDAQIEALRNELKNKQNDFLQALTNSGISAQIESVDIPLFNNETTNVEYRYTLVFNGINLDVPDSNLAALSSMPQVKKVHDVKELTPQLDRSTAYTQAPKLYGQIPELTAYDDHREGYEGQGIYVAVIDTGIDWSNPMFGDDATPPRHGALPPTPAANNNKVTYYLPITGEGVDTYGHGTHVAATSSGYLGWAPGSDGVPNTSDDVPVHGVAPQSKLMGYQVCNVAGRCLTPGTLLALEDAVSPRTLTGYAKPVADVINLSLGGPGGPDDSSAVAASNAALAGAVVVAAAGNDGPGENTLGSPAAGRHVIAVAASNDPGVIPNSVEVLTQDASGPDTSIPAMAAALSADSNAKQPITAPIRGRYVYAGLADTPDQVPVSVAGNICLAKRGSTAEAADNGTGLFTNKAANCQAKGAIATVIYNNEPGEVGAVLAPAATPVMTISGSNGEILQSLGYDAAGISNREIQLNPLDPNLFVPSIAGFSSRGPIIGLGQIKADLAAPGVAILAATTKSGPPTASMANPTGYTSANGTSMASPHVAGAAALVLQANPSWSVATVRAALMNTATNPRFADDTPKADGIENDSILAQGAGLIDVNAAAKTRAIMGIPGDGIIEPEFLASYSYATLPVVNNRILNSAPVTVTMQGLNSEPTTYELSIANNRELQIDGISVRLSKSSVSVSGNDTATFDVVAEIDGDKIRQAMQTRSNGDTSPLQMMWYVVAKSSNGSESLRMPFYLKPTMSEPAAVVGTQSETFNGSLLAGDNNAAAVEGATYIDFPVEVTDAAFRLVGDLTYNGNGIDDIDLFLLDPNGNQIGASTNAGGPEHIEANVSSAGTYTYRVSGWANAPVAFQLNSTQELGGIAPSLSQPAADFVNNQNQSVDFDGEITLNWMPNGGERAFEIEHSSDGENFTLLGSVDATTTEYTVNDVSNGVHYYRVKALFDGKLGFYVSPPSEAVEVLVDRRSKKNITSKVDSSISNVSLVNGVFSLDLALLNKSNTDYVPLMEMKVFKVKSSTGTVKVLNADHGGDGRGKNGAFFSYSNSLGDDQVFSAGETSAVRTLKFDDTAHELFTFRVKVTAYKQRQSSTTSQQQMADAEVEPQPSLEEQVLAFTVNPLTGSVLVDLVEEVVELAP
ncbi:S8 family serine peptidase [Aliikangiella sp. IMCC44653]